MYKQVICQKCKLEWDIQFVVDGLCEECREKLYPVDSDDWEYEEAMKSLL